jgi:hypothetical protein
MENIMSHYITVTLLGIFLLSCSNVEQRSPSSESCDKIIMEAQSETITAFKNKRIGLAQAQSIFKMQEFAISTCDGRSTVRSSSDSHCVKHRMLLNKAKIQTEDALQKRRIGNKQATMIRSMQETATETLDLYCEK